MCQDQSARMIIKRGSGVPTIPVSADHRNGDWIATDIYEGEFYQDTDDGIVYTRNGASIDVAGLGSANFANTDLTFTETRAHNLNGNILGIIEGNTIFQNNPGISGVVVSVIGEDDTALYVTNNDNSKLALDVDSGQVRLVSLPTYADDTSAGVGGLTAGYVYKTATGELRIKL